MVCVLSCTSHSVGSQWELGILLFCQWKVNWCVVWMSLLRAAPALAQWSSVCDIRGEGIHAQYSESFSLTHSTDWSSLPSNMVQKTPTDGLPNIFRATRPTALLIYIGVGAVACG